MKNKKVLVIAIVAIVVVLAVVLGVALSGKETPTTTTTTSSTTTTTTSKPGDEKGEGVMTWLDYVEAEVGSQVVIEAYVQAHQSWWDNKITVYAQDNDGGYFLYDFPCTEEMAAQLTPGTKIRVYGYKAAWAGEIEIVTDELDPDYARIEILEGEYVAEPIDVTAELGKDELIDYQNMFVKFTGLTFVGIEYKNGEPGDDIYVTFSYNGAEYDFCVERYLTGPETELYTLVATLKAGDVVDVEGFAYWYNGINTHITSIEVK